MRFRLIVFLFIVCLISGEAQEARKTAGWVSLSTNPTGAEVFVDGQYLGKTPLNRIALESGKHVVKAFHPAPTAWNGSSKVEIVVVAEGHETTMSWELESTVNVVSIPSGASVYYGGRQLGVTPFLFKNIQELSGNFVVQKEGFEPEYVPVSGRGYFAKTVRLNRENNHEDWSFSDVLSPDSNGEPENQWVNYAAGSAMILSGFLAAYYKDHANRNFDDYQRTKNPEYVNSVRQYDKLSGISITITQLSFAVLAYKLLLE